MLEQMLQSALLLVPILGATIMGGASMSMVYIYFIAFDFFKCWGHSNFEFVPAWFRNLPGVKYLLYTPSSVHAYPNTVFMLIIVVVPALQHYFCFRTDYCYGPGIESLHSLSNR